MKNHHFTLDMEGKNDTVRLYQGSSRLNMSREANAAQCILRAAGFTGQVTFSQRAGHNVELRSFHVYKDGHLVE